MKLPHNSELLNIIAHVTDVRTQRIEIAPFPPLVFRVIYLHVISESHACNEMVNYCHIAVISMCNWFVHAIYASECVVRWSAVLKRAVGDVQAN